MTLKERSEEARRAHFDGYRAGVEAVIKCIHNMGGIGPAMAADLRKSLALAPSPSSAPHDPAKCDGCGEAGYDLSIHSNPDAQAWAAFFAKHYSSPDEDTMRGWFANAMMAMHDHIKRQPSPSSAAPKEEP